MGFAFRWIKWIEHCISTVKFSVQISREPNGFFLSLKGLRQGDPLSPFLFIVAMEGMSNLFNKARRKKWIKGFQLSETNSLEVTHLQYADNTLVFCETKEEQVLVLRVIFIIFKGVSGLHINRGKSFIYPINTISEIDALASKLGGVGELPTTYLGMSLGAKSKSATIWNGVVEKCTNRLTNWKSQHLSMGGKLKTHWSSYLMSIFPMPASASKK